MFLLSLITITKLVAMKELEMENGRIMLLGRSAIFIPAEMLLRLHDLISEEVGLEKADEILFRIGMEQTSGGTSKYMERKKEFATMFKRVSSTGDPGIEMGREMLKFIGVGDMVIKEITKKRIIVSTQYSPFAHERLKSRGKSKRPVCHYLKGLLHGVIEGVGENKFTGNEISCAAMGLSKECVFEFKKSNPKAAE